MVRRRSQEAGGVNTWWAVSIDKPNNFGTCRASWGSNHSFTAAAACVSWAFVKPHHPGGRGAKARLVPYGIVIGNDQLAPFLATIVCVVCDVAVLLSFSKLVVTQQ